MYTITLLSFQGKSCEKKKLIVRGQWHDVIPKLPALPLARSWLHLNSSFYVYQSSYLISHGHCATELVVSDCTRAELSSWIFLCTRERNRARISSAAERSYESHLVGVTLMQTMTTVDHKIARNYPYIFCKKDNISQGNVSSDGIIARFAELHS